MRVFIPRKPASQRGGMGAEPAGRRVNRGKDRGDTLVTTQSSCELKYINLLLKSTLNH